MSLDLSSFAAETAIEVVSGIPTFLKEAEYLIKRLSERLSS